MKDKFKLIKPFSDYKKGKIFDSFWWIGYWYMLNNYLFYYIS